jgi:hypothetical protein
MPSLSYIASVNLPASVAPGSVTIGVPTDSACSCMQQYGVYTHIYMCFQ